MTEPQTEPQTVTKPRTEAGRQLLADFRDEEGDWLAPWRVRGMILAIEAEATQGAAPSPGVNVGCYRCTRTNVPLLVDPKGVVYCAGIVECEKAERSLSERAAPRAEGLERAYFDGYTTGAHDFTPQPPPESEVRQYAANYVRLSPTSGEPAAQAEGAAPRAEGLDQERLARAIAVAERTNGWDWEKAMLVAAEYARLSRPSDERVGEDR